MTETHADQIIDYLVGMLRPPDLQETRRSWRRQLARLDADVASKAAINGCDVWERFPTWPQFYGEYRSLTREQRLAERVMCQTCRDDKWVVVAVRPDGNEEVAGCPDCNPGAYESARFRRHDGTEFVPPDPARVREMLSS